MGSNKEFNPKNDEKKRSSIFSDLEIPQGDVKKKANIFNNMEKKKMTIFKKTKAENNEEKRKSSLFSDSESANNEEKKKKSIFNNNNNNNNNTMKINIFNYNNEKKMSLSINEDEQKKNLSINEDENKQNFSINEDESKQSFSINDDERKISIFNNNQKKKNSIYSDTESTKREEEKRISIFSDLETSTNIDDISTKKSSQKLSIYGDIKLKKGSLLSPKVDDYKNTNDNINDIKIIVTSDENLHTLPSGAVGRRAPLNPFSSPILGKYRRKNKNAKVKVKDPRLNNNPLIGRLTVCISTTAILFWVFFAEMVFNYNTFNGRCISKVLYPIYTENVVHKRQPFFVFLGYGACEYNLDDSASNRHFIGSKASDEGWPGDKVEENPDSRGYANWDSVNSRVYNLLGGLNTNYIRNYGELYRLFWSMYLHGGFMHILFNVICQIQILWMIEPDWGSIRTALLFFVSGITGNLLSAVCDPCGVTIGSSGSLYGLIGALFTYYIEYWKTIPRPCCVLIFMFLVVMFGIIVGMFGYTDNYAHIGGCIGGVLFGFATITTVSAADKCTLGERMLVSAPFSWFLSNETKELINAKAKDKKIKGENFRKKQLANKVHKNDALHVVMAVMKNRINDEGRPPCRMKLREWIVRITAASTLIIMWIVLFIYLLNEKAYKSYSPWGQIKFSGVHSCYCCQIVKDKFTYINVNDFYWCFTTEEATRYYCNK
ncbi:rhomboid protease ROM4 [Plasmodium sp. DRC-Itaito]|nr:rhomboid protease ROM4 [Plasmodium sp. DRC-Itaito]